MGPFLPGPGPLAPAPHFHEPDSAAQLVDAWASIVQSRLVASYRYCGSYSLNASAADQAGPGVEFAPQATARAVAFYEGSSSKTGTVLFSPAVADTWANSTTERQQPNYRPPAAPPINVYDPAANTFADWTPPPVNERSGPGYSPPRSQAISPSITTVLDTWAAATFSRQSAFYASTRALTISVWDPATNTFADWTPAALLSRAVESYSPPAAQPQVAWGESVVTDRFAPLASSRAAALYRSPLARAIAVYDPATNTFSDWTPQALASRQAAWYRAPASLSASVYDQPFVASSTDFAVVVLSRQQAAYRAPLAFLANGFDQARSTDWVAVALSRRVASYRGQLSLGVPVYDQPFVASGTDFVASILSRQQANYRGSYSLNATAADQDATFGTDWASVTQSRLRDNYRSPLSRFLATLGLEDTGCTTLYPDTLLGPDDPLYPTLCAQIQLAYSSQNRYQRRLLDRSFAIPVYGPPTIITPDTWAQAFQSRALRRDPLLRSLAISAYTPTIVTVDTWTQSFASRVLWRDPEQRSLTIPVYDPATNTFADWTPGVIQSRAAVWFSSPSAFWAFALDGASAVLPSDPGGGGYGALMSDEFWHRYHARYEALYKPRYKPTLRKQKR